MAAIVGFLLVASIAVGVAWRVAGSSHRVRRDPTFPLVEVAARHVPVLGALAAFAVTGVVFLVTQAGNVPDPGGTAFTTVLTMFVVAYMGYFSSSVMFANVSPVADDDGFDLPAAQYAGASISLFAVFLGWLALKPLFETFGLTAVAAVTGWLLIGAVVVGYAVMASALFRSGYVGARLVTLMALLAAVGTAAYALVVKLVPDLRSPESALQLTIVAFLLGVPAYLAMALLPMVARREGTAAVLAERWHLAIVAYAQGATVLIGFLLLAVLGLA
jgi:hypothetical protein